MTREPIRRDGHGDIRPMGWEPPRCSQAANSRRRLAIAAAIIILLANLAWFV